MKKKTPPQKNRARLILLCCAALALCAVAVGLFLHFRFARLPEPTPAGRFGVFVGRFEGASSGVLEEEAASLIRRPIASSSLRELTDVRRIDRPVISENYGAGRLADLADQMNAAVLVGREGQGDQRRIVLFLRFADEAAEFPRPDLKRISSAAIYPSLVTVPYHDEGAWREATAILQGHLMLSSTFGPILPAHLGSALGKPKTEAQWAEVNFAAGSMALSAFVAATAGAQALEQAVACLETAQQAWEKEGNEIQAIQATVNLASALLLRDARSGQTRTDFERANSLLDGLKGTIGGHPDAQTQNLATYLRAQVLLGRVAPDVTPEKTVASVVTLLQQLQSKWTREEQPYNWAAAEMLKARAWSRLADSGGSQAIDKGIEAAANALEIWTRNPYPGEWANVQSLLGSLYARRTQGDRQQNLQAAIDGYENALQVWRRDTMPAEWARDTVGLATARLGLQGGKPGEHTRKSIEELEQALTVVKRESSAAEWARIQNTLGVAWHALEPNRERLEKSLEHFRAALEVRKPETHPLEAARTLANMGNVYRELASRTEDPERYLGLSLKAYDAAIQAMEHSLDRRFVLEIEKNRQKTLQEMTAKGMAE